ncbi:MAG: ribonuclease R [Chlamydiae bacterium CG10_big_fil_rev_8_21_14_0_10_42_34]|nr:MAG: ribonuclease R [Chlamydiae bacterium CG10_big_fil_rev_8_21_14_0_10_42_34]
MTFKKRKGSSRQPKVASNLTRTLTQYIRGKRYSPSSFSELITQLDIAEVHKPLFKEILDGLVHKGELAIKAEKYVIPSSAELVTGTISVHKKGFGFVRCPVGPDVFVPKHCMMNAVDGDTVEVEVNPVVSAKGPEGVVVAIIKRSRTHLACIIIEKTQRHYVAYAPLLGPTKPVKILSKTTLKNGDRIICKVLDWKTDADVVKGEMTRLIGHISDPSIDVKAAIEEFELPDGFSKEAISEAKAWGKKVTPEGRKDITDWEVVTIDPDTAKDYDDAISLTKDERGHFFLGVHIADVSHYVKPASHLDQEAFLRCNSTYFPGCCVPMLPEELSNELCSLKPKVERLTQSVFAEFNPAGDLVNYKIERACIKSKKRFTYKEALAVIEKKKKSVHAALLDRMVELCLLLKKKRFERGSIDFSMPDDVIIVDDKGVPLKIERVEYDITHQMIEEFMLKANEITAKHLADQGKTLIYRVHENPTEESFQDFYTFARSLGFHLPATPTHHDIQKMFLNAKDSPFLPQLSVSFIRSMRLAAYSSENLGHYGLALEHYCHFTSPIRRYTDLIIQRLLFDELPPDTDVDAIAAACSEKERVSFKAESSVVILKKLRLANTHFEADPEVVYPATITRVKPFALFFEVPMFDLEGNIHVSKLGGDYYEFNPKKMSFRGSRTGKTFIAGQEIFVRLVKIDYILLQSEWAIVSPPATKAKKKK